jgi:hypothetical protein
MEASEQTAPIAEKEISFEDALKEEGQNESPESAQPAPPAPPRPRPGSIDQPLPPEAPRTAPSQPQAMSAPAEPEEESDLEVLAPTSRAKEWKFGSPPDEYTYIQRELSVIGKAQWFGLVGEIVDKSLGGDNSLSLNSLLSPPENVRPGNIRMQDFQDADTFVHAVGKLLVHSTEFLEKSICIWLSVPDYEWDLAREMFRLSPDLGGLSDDQAEEMLNTFIDQNYVAISRFFSRQVRSRSRSRGGSSEGSGTISLIEALEDYSSSHPETIAELVKWSSTKFERFYASFQKRKVIAGLERQKSEMIAALWSNSNFDDDKGSRKKAIEQIESSYEESLEKIASITSGQEPEEEIDSDNPFFAAAARGMDKLEKRVGHLVKT